MFIAHIDHDLRCVLWIQSFLKNTENPGCLLQVLVSSLPVGLASVDCSGTETSLLDCTSSRDDIQSCDVPNTNLSDATVLACANSTAGVIQGDLCVALKRAIPLSILPLNGCVKKLIWQINMLCWSWALADISSPVIE